MNPIARLSLSVALVAGSAVAAAAPTVINFDNLAGGSLSAGTLVTNQYSGLGVTFSDTAAGGSHAENVLGTLIPGSSLPNVLWTDQGSGGATGQFLQVTFASAVTGVSALYGTSLGADITMQAFSGASLIDALTTTGAVVNGDVRSGTISLGDAGITSVRLFSHSGTSSFNFSIDNLAFTAAAAVPEPESYALMLAGLGLVSLAARRRKRAAAR